MSPKLLNILLILVPAVLYFGYIDPVYNGNPGFLWNPELSIPQLKAQNVQYANSINQVALIEEGVMKIDKEYKAVKPEEKQKIELMLSDSVDVIKLRNEILGIASRSGVAVSNLKVEPEKISRQSSEIGRYDVAFSIKTRYPVFKKLMESYERNLRFYNLESVKIKRVDPDSEAAANMTADEKTLLTIDVSLKVNYLK